MAGVLADSAIPYAKSAHLWWLHQMDWLPPFCARVGSQLEPVGVDLRKQCADPPRAASFGSYRQLLRLRPWPSASNEVFHILMT